MGGGVIGGYRPGARVLITAPITAERVSRDTLSHAAGGDSESRCYVPTLCCSLLVVCFYCSVQSPSQYELVSCAEV